jgi:hypothetical protein
MAKKPKYQKTKELIGIALREGLTQKGIGDLCRVQQGQVSKWKSGNAFANVDQVKPLLDRFGHFIRHSPFKVYQFQNEYGNMSFLKVEGKLLLREKFRAIGSGNAKPPLPEATCIRVSIHRQNEGQYAVVFERTTAKPPTKTDGYVITLNDRHAEWVGFPPSGDDDRVLTFDDGQLMGAVQRLYGLSKKHAWWQQFQGLQALPLMTAEAMSRQGVILDVVEVIKPAE